jgi:hypothetical protein
MRSAAFSILIAFLGATASSCLFMGPSVKGDGNIKEETRKVGDFHGISVTSGMNVQILQGETSSVKVIADENLHEIIETEVEDGILEIRARANIWMAKEKKVVITASNLDEISGTAGSNIRTDGQLVAGKLQVKGSAGSNIHLDIDGQSVEISASSGSNIFMEGIVRELAVRTSSGANIKAGDIHSLKCDAKASSGGNVWVSVQNELTADASSGGNIFYAGSPETLNINSSSGGNIIKR